MGDIVALVKHKGDLSALSRAETLKEAMDLIGGLGRPKSPFVIKVNLCTHPLWDITRFGTTSPKMVEALISLALKEDKELSVKIVESDSNDKFMDEATFNKYGYKDLEKRFGELGFDVSLINLSRPPLVKVRFDGLYFRELEMHKLLTEPRHFVSLAMAKTHFTVVSGVVKNLFGLLPRKRKGFYHPRDGSIDFHDVLIDLNRFATPDLSIIDAIVGLEGVTHGRPRRLNAIIVGKKPACVEATMARLIGFEPEKIPLLVKAEEYGLGNLNPEVLGERPESMTVKFKPLAWPPRPAAKTTSPHS